VLRGRKLTAFLLPMVAAAAALAATWKCWIDPLVDSGRELDVPWRLAQGERLYRDVTYYYGPLGPWINAAVLRLFGARWLGLEIVCAALAMAIFILTFRITRRAGSVLSATAATTLAAALCMGAPRGGAFIFPYSSSALIALAGALLAIDLAGFRGGWPALLGTLGLAASLSSRLEIGGAAAAVLIIVGLHTRPAEGSGTNAAVRSGLARVVVGVLIALGVYAAAFRGIAWRQLVADGPLTPLLAMPKEWKALYADTAGIVAPAHSAGYLFVAALVDILLIFVAARFALPTPAHPRGRFLFPLMCGLALVACWLGPWYGGERNLPPLLAVLPIVALVAAATVWLVRRGRPLSEPERSRFLLFGFSGIVGLRIALGLSIGPRMSCYIPVALPGLLATAAVLIFDLLAWRLPAPIVFRRRVLAMLAIFCVAFLYRMARIDHGPQIVELDTAAGTLRLPATEARAIGLALGDMTRRARQGDTLTAFPESGFFNFVLGLRSPLHQDLFLPGVAAGQLEVSTVQQIERAGPRFILLCNRPTPEYGKSSFGRDYAQRLWSKVGERYALAHAYGPAPPTAPVGASDFFVRLYVRSSGPVDRAAANIPTRGHVVVPAASVEVASIR
jgi:hypothetical protein